MAEVCVSKNLDITGGVLGIEPWTYPQAVLDVTANSTGDGAITTALTTLPGRQMIDIQQSWLNSAPIPRSVLVRLLRGRRSFVTSNPNIIQVRDRYTYAIDKPALLPDVSSTYLGQSGGGIDAGATDVGTPYALKYWQYDDPCMHEDFIGPVPAGSTLNIWYRCYAWTPPPWSNNANAGAPEHSVAVNNARLQLMAFPALDPDIVR